LDIISKKVVRTELPDITSLKNSLKRQVGYAYIYYTIAVYHAAFRVNFPVDVCFNYPFHLEHLPEAGGKGYLTEYT
jgi:hypothetical protein